MPSIIINKKIKYNRIFNTFGVLILVKVLSNSYFFKNSLFEPNSVLNFESIF